MCFIVVKWENHEYETMMDNSLTYKMFMFQFTSAYAYLFYYALVAQDFNTLQVQTYTMIAAQTGIKMFNSNILPWAFNYAFSLNFKKTWKQYTSTLEMNLKETIQNFDQNPNRSIPWLGKFFALDSLGKKNIKEDMTQLKKKLHQNRALHKGVEKSRSQFVYEIFFEEQAQPCLQFGFITIFTAGCPGAPLLCYILNYIDLKWTSNTYSKY
jgi:hypothetical protein